MKRDSIKDFLLDQLRELSGLKCRAMFGGYGLYAGENFFGLIHSGRVYFKTDAASREIYRGRGMKYFQPNARQKLAAYYEVPADVIEQADELKNWAHTAIRVAQAAP